MSPSPAFTAMLEILKTTEGNIRSLGPAGALNEVWPCYRVWLQLVQEAIAAAETELDPR